MEDNHIISSTKKLIDALKQLNSFRYDPLVLFVVDEDYKMVGTITDGDARRALISGKSVYDKLETFMHRNFKFLQKGIDDDVAQIHELKKMRVKLVPILGNSNQIEGIINLDKFNTLLPMAAVLMAGGKGVRLRPLTETTPKPLLPVGGKPIIDYNIDSLMENGIKHISVTVNYLHEQLEEHFAQPVNGVKVDCIKEPQFLGTMGATQFVPKFYNDVVLVMNSDLFTNIDYEDFYLHFKEHNADMSVAAVPYSVSIPYGIFDLDGRNIKGVKEKPVYNYFANAGIYLIKRELLENMPKNTFYNATDLMNDAVAAGKTVIRYPITGYWLDIGSHEEYKKANELVKHIKK